MAGENLAERLRRCRSGGIVSARCPSSTHDKPIRSTRFCPTCRTATCHYVKFVYPGSDVERRITDVEFEDLALNLDRSDEHPDLFG